MPAALPFRKETLDNGLDVIVHEARACPIVAVSIWYHVGSKNERPGRTGFAHLFEHLMFEGSAHHDAGYFRPLEEAGGALNGSTNADRTNYWEVVPREALERALWLESDRMGYLLPALSAAKFATQNRPYGLASVALAAAQFPAPHPYHWPTIGMPADLHAASLDDVREFFVTYYHPGNASLAIAGDIAADEALALAAHFFGDIPAGPSPPPVAVPAESALPPPGSRAVASVSDLADASALRSRRCGARSAGRASGGRALVAPPPGPGARSPAGDGRCRLAGLARDGGALHGHGHRRGERPGG